MFAGSCTLATAARVGGDEENEEGRVLDVLSSLVDRSLIVADCNSVNRAITCSNRPRIRAEKLTARGEAKALSRRHAVRTWKWLGGSSTQPTPTSTRSFVNR